MNGSLNPIEGNGWTLPPAQLQFPTTAAGLLGRPANVASSDLPLLLMLSQTESKWALQKGAMNKAWSDGVQNQVAATDQRKKCEKHNADGERMARLRRKFKKWVFVLVAALVSAFGATCSVLSSGTLTPLMQMLAFTLINSVAQSVSNAANGGNVNIADLLARATAQIAKHVFHADDAQAKAIGDLVSSAIALAIDRKALIVDQRFAANLVGGAVELGVKDQMIVESIKAAVTVATTVLLSYGLSRNADLGKALTKLKLIASRGLTASNVAGAGSDATRSGMNYEVQLADMNLKMDERDMAVTKLFVKLLHDVAQMDMQFLKKIFHLTEDEVRTIYQMFNEIARAEEEIVGKKKTVS